MADVGGKGDCGDLRVRRCGFADCFEAKHSSDGMLLQD